MGQSCEPFGPWSHPPGDGARTTSWAVLAPKGGVIAWSWDANGPVDDRLDTLRDRTDQLLGELLVVRSWLRQQGLDHTSALAKVEASLRADVQSIQQTLDETKQGAEQTDAEPCRSSVLASLLPAYPT